MRCTVVLFALVHQYCCNASVIPWILVKASSHNATVDEPVTVRFHGAIEDEVSIYTCRDGNATAMLNHKCSQIGSSCREVNNAQIHGGVGNSTVSFPSAGTYFICVEDETDDYKYGYDSKPIEVFSSDADDTDFNSKEWIVYAGLGIFDIFVISCAYLPRLKENISTSDAGRSRGNKLRGAAVCAAFVLSVLSLISTGWGHFHTKISIGVDSTATLDTDVGLFFLKYKQVIKTTAEGGSTKTSTKLVQICKHSVDDDDDDSALTAVPFYNSSGSGCSFMFSARHILMVAVCLGMMAPCARAFSSTKTFRRNVVRAVVYANIIFLECYCGIGAFSLWNRAIDKGQYSKSYGYAVYILMTSAVLYVLLFFRACQVALSSWRQQERQHSIDGQYKALLPDGPEVNSDSTTAGCDEEVATERYQSPTVPGGRGGQEASIAAAAAAAEAPAGDGLSDGDGTDGDSSGTAAAKDTEDGDSGDERGA